MKIKAEESIDREASNGRQLNKVQKAAYDLIREDARFFYAITDIAQNARNINSNYICMSMPYMGIFTEGSEQWCKKVGARAPEFDIEEKSFYSQIRQGHKLFEKSYNDYQKLLVEKLCESEMYFHDSRRIRERVFGHNNIGTDLCNGEFCGNTILCAMYIPIKIWGNNNAGPWLGRMSCIAGKLAAHFGCTKFPVYKYDDCVRVKYKDYHFFGSSPLKMNNNFGMVLFSVLCSINYVIEFIENYFTEEIPQKIKYAYLQYYYLCDFVRDLNAQNGTDFFLNSQLYNREFRNCLAHYGLGQYLNEQEIVSDDLLKGLTLKAFGKDCVEIKKEIYKALKDFAEQIKEVILKEGL